MTDTVELSQLTRHIKEREEYVERVRAEASDLEKRAQQKWNDVQALEEKLSADLDRIAELQEAG